MPIRELLSELRGSLVISREEGVNLGGVSQIYLDPETRCISGIILSSRRGTTRFIRAEHLVTLGRDVVFVDSESSVVSTAATAELPGRSLKSLQGMWVTTKEGKHLGHLVDVNVSGDAWELSELCFAEGTELPVIPNEISIGQDEIIVPPEYSKRVVASDVRRDGFLGRMLGPDSIEEARAVILRAFGRGREGASKQEPTADAPKREDE